MCAPAGLQCRGAWQRCRRPHAAAGAAFSAPDRSIHHIKNVISFLSRWLIKLLTCASPNRRINSCLYKCRRRALLWLTANARHRAGGDPVFFLFPILLPRSTTAPPANFFFFTFRAGRMTYYLHRSGREFIFRGTAAQ